MRLQQEGYNDREGQNLQRLKNLCLMDDEFMSKYFEDNAECTELVLHIIIGKEDLKVKQVQTQKEIKNLQGRSVRLDILATDSRGRKYNIEIQRVSKGAGVKRARYNSSLLDANITWPGENFEELAETYVVFITERDVLGKKLPIYHVERMIRETGEYFGDETHILYVNASCQDATPLGLLMKDFFCPDPSDMNYPILAERAKYFKEKEKGVTVVSRIFDEVREEGVMDARMDIAENLLADGEMTVEKIAKVTRLPLEEVTALAKELKEMPLS